MMKFNSKVRYFSSIVKTFSGCLFLITFLFVVQPQSSIGSPPIAAGFGHTVALQSNGEVWAWGSNSNGQLGDGTQTNSLTQVQVSDATAPSGYIENVSAVAAGEFHTVALKHDGTVWTWGKNDKGQLGNATTTDSPILVSVTYGWVTSAGTSAFAGAPILNVSAIEAGSSHTVALKTDGTVWCTGSNSDGNGNVVGQLGNGWIPDRSIMIQAKNLTGVAAIAAGDYHTVALKTDGTVWTWGLNDKGQLGNGTTTNSRIPVQVKDSNDPSGFLHNVSAIAAGGKHTVALKKSDKTIWAWGDNSSGQIGDGTSSTSKHFRPVMVTASSYGFSAIAAGQTHTVALDIDGNVWAWGNNLNGQLGNGTTISNNMPLLITGVSDIAAIDAGYKHTVVMQNDGTVWAWGDNEFGQLGDATTQNSLTPVQSYWIQLFPSPTVVTGIADSSSITTNSATLKGTVNPNGSPATCYFEYGPTLNYGQFTTSQSVGSGNSIVNVTASITGLTPATLYNFRLVAWNSTGTEPALPGNNMTFTTKSAVPNPSLTIGDGTGVTGGTVTVDLKLLTPTEPPTEVASISTDIDFDPNVLENPSAVIGAAGSSAGKSISSTLVDSNTFRVGVFSISSRTERGALPTPIEDGIIANVTFKIKSTVPNGTVTRLTHTAGGSDTTAAGNPVDVDVDALPIFPGAAITISRACFLGDSNDDNAVSISEVQAAINMFLGISPVQPYCDWNGDGILSIFEIQIIINKYLSVPDTPPRPNC